MKTSILKKLIYSALISIFFIGMSMNGYAQCGTEPITVSPWCENGYAQWNFTSPTANAQYNWYNYAAGPYTYDANGFISQNNGTPISAVDTTTGNTFNSTFRITSPITSVEYTYQKSVKYKNINPFPAVTPTLTNNASNSTFSMDFNTNVTNARGIRIDSVSVPVVLTGTPGTQYKIQINFGTLGGPGSAIYTFTSFSAKSLGGNNYLVKIPVNYTITTGGAQTMFVNTNPTGGTGVSVNGLLYAPSHAPAFSATGNPISIAAGSGDAGPSGGFSQIYDLSYSIVCSPLQSGASTKTTVGCCVIPANYNLFSVNPDKNAIVNGGAVSVNFAAGGTASNYFGWYLNGTFVTGAVGLKNYSSNLVGNWEVREVINSADINNPSCVARANATIYDKKIVITNTSAPSHTPLCIGDKWTFTGTGASTLTWSSGKPTLSPTTGTSTTYTASSTGTDLITLSGKVVSGDLVVKGNFTGATDVDFGHTGGYSTPAAITGADGNFTIVSTAPTQSDWNANGTKPLTQGNPGEFLLVNGTGNATSKPVIWSQNLNVQAQQYTFSFDLTSVTYMVSDNADGSNFGGTATAPWRDVVLEVFINGVSQGTASTNFAVNGGLAAVGQWKTHQFIWNSPSAGMATVEIRQITPTATQLRGYDYGIDNISFGGLVTQTDTYAIGNVTDCSTLTAAASACVNDTYSNLTATLTGGLVFRYWELASNPGASVGTTNPLQVSSMTATSYNAVATLAVGNLLDNGDFESGPSTGFISGGQYYTASTNLSNGGSNAYNVSTDTKNGNGAWLTLPPAPGSTGTRIFAADAKGPVGQKIIAWQFSATAGQQYFFSGWASNNHIDFTNTNAATANPASIGVVITSGTPTYPGNPLLTSVALPRTNSWQKMTSTWTAPSTGTFTLYLVDLNGASGGSNDFVLDDFVLAPSTGIIKKAPATTPVCNPCLLNLPTLGSPNTFCANTGIVHLTPNASELNGVFTWYDALTGGNKLGTSQGIDPDGDTLNVSTAASSGANKIVYYQKSAKGTGTVFKKAQSCGSFNGGDRTNSADQNFQTQFTATKAVTITQVGLTIFSQLYNNGDSQTGTVTFTIVGAKAGNGGQVADPSVVYGTVTATYSRTRTAAAPTQDVYADIVATGNVSVPAGLFFIYPTTVSNSGQGGFNLQRGSNCTQANTVDDLDGLTVSRTGMSQGSSNNQTGGNNTPGYVHDVVFSVPAYVCPRTAVTLTPQCPCSKPTAVAITAPASTPITLCQGIAQTLSGTVTVAAAPLNTAFTYSWFKTAGSGASTTVPLTTGTLSPNPTVNTATAVPNNTTAITGPTTGAGTYVLRVEDGNTGNSSCYTEATVVVVVNPTTVPGVIATSQTICTGDNPAAFTVTTPASGGDGTSYAYVWESDIATSGTYLPISGGTNATYDEGVLTNTGTTPRVINYRRKVTSGVCPQVTSNVISITVNPAVVPGVVAGDQTVCSPGDPAAFTQTTAATGGSGTFTYQWQSSLTNVAANFTNITNATNATYDAPAGLTATTYYRRIDGSLTCATGATNVITVTVPAALVPGTVTANQTICYNTAPAAFTSTAAATGGNGTFAYQWQSSNTTGTGFTNITNATNATYTETALLTADKYYRRQVTSGAVASCNVAYTTEIRITVSPNFVVGSIGGTQTVCQTTGDPTVLTSASLPTGGQATYTYQWKSSTTAGGPYTNITNATNATYDPPAGLTATTYFVREGKSAGGCGTLTTNQITVTVTPTVVPSVTIATPSTTICTGTSVTFTATPTNGGTPTYQWKKNNVDITNATNATYTTTAAANNDSYTVVMTSTAACASPVTVTSNAIVMSVTTVVTPAVTIAVSPGTTICAGASITFTATAGNGGSGPTYQWFKGTPPSGGTSLGAASTNNTYTTTTAANGDSYYVVMTSNSTCVVAPGTATSTAIVMTVNPNLTPSVAIAVSPTGAICSGANLTFTATPTNGGTPTYQWFKGTPPSGGTSLGAPSTNNTYSTTTAANGDSYYVVMTSTANCASPTTATSTPIVTTVNPILVPSVTVAASPTTICRNGSTTFTATPTNGGTPAYQWYINNVLQTGATNATFPTTALIASTDVVKVTLTSNALCASPLTADGTASVTVNAGIGGGTVSITTATICYNTIPGAMTQTVAPVGIVGTPTYRWLASATGAAGSFTAIPGATNSSYTPTLAITSDVYIQREVTDPGTPAPCNVALSNTIHIAVNPQLVAGTIAGNETTCANVSTTTISSASLPTGGTGTYTYQWQSGTTAGGPYTNIPSATNTTYSPGILTTTTYFVRVETSGTCGSVTSNQITKTVNPVLVPGVTLAASPTTICTNGSTTFTATPTNPGAAPMYEWFIKTGSGSFVSQGAPSSSATFSTTALVSSTDVVQVTMTSNALCATPATASATRSVTVNAGIGSGTVGIATATICYNTIPGAITETVAPTNIAGTPTYVWEASPTGLPGTFLPIPAATNISYTPTIAITQDAYIRRVITDPGTPAPCNVATSNTVHIIVRPQLIAGVIGSGQTTCAGDPTTTISETTAPTGGTGTYTYQWQSSATGVTGSFTNIVSATNATYNAGNLTATTYYQLVETSGTCGNVTTNIVTKTVTQKEVVTAVIDNTPSQVCITAGTIVFTANGSSTTGSGTLHYQWYLGTPGNPVGTDNPSYTYTISTADNGKTVGVIVSTSTACNAGTSTATYTLDIVSSITPTVVIATPNNPNCAALASTFTATPTNAGVGATYQWYVVPAGSPVGTLGNPVGAGLLTYSTSTLANGDRVRVDLTSTSGCLSGPNPFKSNEITMVIKPIPAPMIQETDQTVCSPASVTFHGTVTPGNTYEWRLAGAVVGTNANYTATQAGSYTLYEDNGTCNSTSQAVNLTVVQTPIANAGADIYLKQGETGNLNGSGGSTYSWSPATYLSSATVSNPSFTATQTITYTLTVSNTSGATTCSTTDDVTVFVVKPIEVPNVITVNGDGANDDWEIKNIEGYPNVTIEIYNRWGNLVWKSAGYPKNWDGTNYRNGEVLSDGTYFYIIDLHSEVYPEPLTGWIQIIK